MTFLEVVLAVIVGQHLMMALSILYTRILFWWWSRPTNEPKPQATYRESDNA